MEEVLKDSYYGKTLLLTVVYQFGFFLVSLIFNTHKVTDFAGCTSFVFLSALTFFSVTETIDFHDVRTINSFLQIVWGLRLGLFLFYRIFKWGKDKRLNEKWYRVCIFWTLQVLWSWSVSLSVLYVNDPNNKSFLSNQDINTQDYIGWTMWIIGFLYETIADFQKLSYREGGNVTTAWPTHGAWANSRHPNYFGEILLWWGLFVSVSGHLREDNDYFIISSPLVTMFLLIFLSGIPLIEKKYDHKFGQESQYVEYVQSTSPLIPMPTSVYRNLPRFIKSVLFFDYSYWNKNVHSQATGKEYQKLEKED